MFQIECDVSNINYQNIIDFVLQNQIKKADPDLRPFLEDISLHTDDIVQAFTASIPEKNVQTALIYVVNTYQHKLKEMLEKTLLKKGAVININSIVLTVPKNTQLYHVNLQFEIISYSHELFKRLQLAKFAENLVGKAVAKPFLALLTKYLKKKQNFVEIKNLNVSVI